MRTRAAICRGPGQWWELTELELDEPKPKEVRVRFRAAGLCHSDDHVRTGDAPVRYPMVGGHEGAGVVDAVGPDVSRVKVGDRIICSYIPVCGTCRPCSTGHQNLCEAGLHASTGMFLDNTFRFHSDGEDLGGFCGLGTFSEYAIVSEWACITIDDGLPFEVAALLGCGVPTGWGSAVHAAGVRAGDTVVIYGAGGVGSNAVQGARLAGAKHVVVIDPVPFKLEMATFFGATHTFADQDEARDFLVDTTWGQLADHAICTQGVLTEEVVTHATALVGKRGQVTITAVGRLHDKQVNIPGVTLIGYERTLQGALFGGCNPLFDVPRLIGLYRSGDLKLDELITTRYSLEQVNDASQDMLDGKNIRGVIVHAQ